ncbi:Major Facilitator Superfamily protein [Thiohalomonas denitrificans]|uniref:Major Facilitator Superfamily protein n=1 Tax=Thiohalomonas denitrificans TaxID=415747 RepID=A0A1G5QPM2_9GAMM|nr:OFA family MFS transporter [Thiohalomonas denitrificans]SCZ63261.1 Major Facilitator Superfamily protein [Thiohalomonas denitrificans]
MSFLAKERIVAGPGFNRWLIPPAALAVHLSIGQAYALSVFNLPMSRLLGVTEPAASDWGLTTTVWIFNIAFFFLGISAALFGKWVERVGPRKAMFAAAFCFGGGFFVSALGVYLHQIGLVYLGYGVLGGVGLGIGYLSPVSTLMKWFPDRPGMATGLAIMGFGGGAMLGSPLAVSLMDFYATPLSVGVWETMLTMGAIYFCMIMFGMWNIRIPAPGWRPASMPATSETSASNANGDLPGMEAGQAIRTRQFWLLWIVLCVNVTAGIGILAQASPMIQEMYSTQMTVAAAAGFVGLLSLFNLVGRIFWSSLSDKLGRQWTYTIFLGFGAVLYASVPSLGQFSTPLLFVAAAAIIVSMYGGGFATVPAYLRDLFGMKQVGAIHGRLLTAWSTAAIIGPSLVTYLREFQINAGVAPAEAYSTTMYILAGLLLIGLTANLLIRKCEWPDNSAQRVAA